MRLPHPSSLHLALVATLPFALSPTARAQLSDWSSIPVTSGNPTFVHEQTVLGVTDGNTVHAYSAMTRTWSSIEGVFGTPIATRYNEHLIVQDGPIFYGYSPRTASYQAQLTTTPGAAMLTAPFQSWHTVVTDGNLVHAYFALTGHWTTFVFDAPPSVTFGRMCFLIDDGSTVYAVSAYHGTMVPAPAAAPTVLGAYLATGLVHANGTLYAFSAHRNKWTSTPVSTVPSVTTGSTFAGVVALQDGPTTLFYGAHPGTFASVTPSAGAAVIVNQYVACVVDGTTVHMYSGLNGAAQSQTFAAPPFVDLNSGLGLVDDGTGLTPFSAHTGTFGPKLPGNYLSTTKSYVALVTPTTSTDPTHAYSSYVNAWTPVPAGLSAPQSYLSGTSILLVDGGGDLHGYSTRFGTWVAKSSPLPPDAVHVGPATILVRTGLDLNAWNPRTNAWRTKTTTAPALTVNVQYTAMVANDGINAYGFGHYTDRWATTPLAGPSLKQAAQVQSAYVYDGARVHAYSAIGQVSSSGDNPDFWRAASWGGRLRIDVSGEPFSPTMLLFALGAANVPTPYGDLLLDPQTIALVVQPGIPGGGITGLWVQLPPPWPRSPASSSTTRRSSSRREPLRT